MMGTATEALSGPDGTKALEHTQPFRYLSPNGGS